MIARVWTGPVPKAKANEYIRLMADVALPDYRSIEGNRGAWCLHRDDGGNVIVTMLTFWQDIDAIRRFAGEPVSAAKYYDFDPDFLLEMRESVEHYDIVEG